MGSAAHPQSSARRSRRAGIVLVASLALACAALLASTPSATRAQDSIAMCLNSCHASVGIAPDIESVYEGGAESAGHKMGWGHRVVADSSGALLPKGAQMPCDECHVGHGTPTSSIYQFKEDRTGGPVVAIRQMCLGCHRPSDSSEPTPTVCGLELKRLPDGEVEHLSASTTPCVSCHTGSAHAPEKHSGGSCAGAGCHDATGSHSVHTSPADPRGPAISCDDCHDTDDYPFFASGVPGGDGKIDFSETDVCDACHSAGGLYDGVDSSGSSVGARDNWATGVYSSDTTLGAGNELWCAGCHDDAGAVVASATAPNTIGDGATYGFYVTGHGRDSAFARMNWQGAAASGNPAADRECPDCHDLGADHIGAGAGDRLRAGMENDADDSNCTSCHAPGTAAVGAPDLYDTYAAYEGSAHAGEACTDCHDVHGMAGTAAAMTRAADEALCDGCHGAHEGHAIDTSFGDGSDTYALQCVHCHNVHVLTGMYSASEPNASPVTLFTDSSEAWGDEAGEKMEDFAGTGTYRTPKNDTLDGTVLPDYPTFCLDCHGISAASFGTHGDIPWGTNRPHGLNSANVPNGGGAVPNWYGAGKGEGWDGDDRVGDTATVWPVIPRGRGEQIFSRAPYSQEERIGGANFVLSCSDCHVTHEAGVGQKLRTEVNGGDGSVIWNTMCNNCHYYYSDWHAGMSCGSASCHASNSLHRAGAMTGSGATRTFNRDLVAYFPFNGNLNDAGDWRMHGTWRVTSGSFVGGYSGNAVEVSDDPIEIGTTNEYWSTDEGRHGTWKYTEMRDTMTLEAWVYPTEDTSAEYNIMAKHTYWNGGYTMQLRKVDGTLRAALLTNVTGGGPTWPDWDGDDCNGLRGAYSSVPVELNRWTHIAVTYDSSGPDRDASDPTVGRVRIYVNGDDVTTSNAPTTGECYSQPGPGEDTMFPYSMHSPDNEEICYEGHWCASAFSIGGVNWSSPGTNFVGRLDEAKIWNVTKAGSFFSGIDGDIAPWIRGANGEANRIYVGFSEEVFTSAGATGALEPGDFVLTDVGGNNPKSIVAVDHIPGETTATITLDTPLVAADYDTDTLAAAASAIFDETGAAMGAGTVTINGAPCPNGLIEFTLDESAGATSVEDSSGIIVGTVNQSSPQAMGGGVFTGNATDNYISFTDNDDCLTAERDMTVEFRIKPANIPNDTTTNYIRRIIARDQGGNWQTSVWRNTSWAEHNPPAGTASIALWVKPVDANGGSDWKLALTDYATHPIVSDHWYQVRVMWDSDATGIPATIYVDDQGTDGAGAGENWSGYVDATDADQDKIQAANRLFEGDVITAAAGDFTIGCNVNNNANNVFDGQIDWITWEGDSKFRLFPLDGGLGLGAAGAPGVPRAPLGTAAMAAYDDLAAAAAAGDGAVSALEALGIVDGAADAIATRGVLGAILDLGRGEAFGFGAAYGENGASATAAATDPVRGARDLAALALLVAGLALVLRPARASARTRASAHRETANR